MFYDQYYWGMHFIWRFVCLGLLLCFFVVPYDIDGRNKVKSTPLDILQKQLAWARSL
jgi:putative membrane protein